MSKRICIFGDSITEGFYDYEEGGWANRLKKYFENNDNDNIIYNLGISGDNTDDLLKRFDAEARTRDPEIIIFTIGINDSSYRESLKGNKTDFKKFNKNLKVLLNKAKIFTDKVIFIGITRVDENKTAPLPWNTDASYKNKDIQEYNKAIKGLCEKNNLPFIDMYDLLNKEDLEDGLHPNSSGHEKMFQRVKDFLIDNKIIS